MYFLALLRCCSNLFLGETEQIPSDSATGSAINIFFYNVEVVNNVTNIVLEWTLGSEKKTQVLDVNSVTRMVNELRTTVPQPPGVTFKVMRQDDRSSLKVNNVEEMEVLPSTSREEFTVLDITSEKGKLIISVLLCDGKFTDIGVQYKMFYAFYLRILIYIYIYFILFSSLDSFGEELHIFYFNYQFVNRAGVQIEISFNEFGRPEKVTLDVDDVLNWLRIFRARSAPAFVLRANIKSNDAPIKINGQDSYRMEASDHRDEVFVIDVSQNGKLCIYV